MMCAANIDDFDYALLKNLLKDAVSKDADSGWVRLDITTDEAKLILKLLEQRVELGER